VPRVMEMMDRTCMDLMERYGEVHFDRGAESAVLVELDGSAAAVADQVERAGGLLGEAGAREVLLLSGAVERSRFWEARRQLSEYVKRAYPGKVSDDISVPRGRMVEAVEAVYGAAERHGLLAAVYGHAGDGNLHVNFMSRKQGTMAGEAPARDEVMRRVLALGGVVSGEHGIGTLKRKYLAWQQGRTLRAVEKKIKKLLDPQGILNPGKVF
jgi:glycolate oxidase